MRSKDAIVSVLVFLGIVFATFVITTIDSWGLLPLAVLAITLWVAYILVVVRDYQRFKKAAAIWMIVEDEQGVERWTAMDGTGRTRHRNDPPPAYMQPARNQKDK